MELNEEKKERERESICSVFILVYAKQPLMLSRHIYILLSHEGITDVIKTNLHEGKFTLTVSTFYQCQSQFPKFQPNESTASSMSINMIC